jgi:hypothetical protein
LVKGKILENADAKYLRLLRRCSGQRRGDDCAEPNDERAALHSMT